MTVEVQRSSTPQSGLGPALPSWLERVLLTATVRGLSTTLMTEPLEIPHLRSRLYEPTGGLSPQVIVRLGYGPPSAPSPRRPWESFVD